MITDIDTNQLYLADSLPQKQLEFFQRFEIVLNRCNIPFEFLPNTKDIWAVDYMPVQISKSNFIQFIYNPDYLQGRKYQKTISEIGSICNSIGITTKKCGIKLDGGNVSRTKDKVLMCDKVFSENKNIPEKELIKQLKDLFEVDKLFFVPWDKKDIIGHVDGMARFINDDTVLVNAYTDEDREIQLSLRSSLHNAGLDWIELPFHIPKGSPSISAEGLYLNYLQMEQAVIVPIFNSKYDDIALRIFEDAFKAQNIETVDSTKVAKDGGVLNCISWNIRI